MFIGLPVYDIEEIQEKIKMQFIVNEIPPLDRELINECAKCAWSHFAVDARQGK